ncbi:hypothetical protein D3C81_1406680 [compost metagenome]
MPPLSRVHQISSVAASNARLAVCSMTVAASNAMKFGASASRRMADCGKTTPFGVPVEPEV